MNNSNEDPIAAADLPPWIEVFDDLVATFADSKASRIDDMFEKGEIDRDDLIEKATLRLDRMAEWTAACKEYHDRFGFAYRDCEVGDTFDVSWDPEEWDRAQFYLSHTTQFLVHGHRDNLWSRHHRPDDEHDVFWIEVTDRAEESWHQET